MSNTARKKELLKFAIRVMDVISTLPHRQNIRRCHLFLAMAMVAVSYIIYGGWDDKVRLHSRHATTFFGKKVEDNSSD